MSVIVSVTLTDEEHALANKLSKEHGLPLAQCVKQFPLCEQVFIERFEALKQRAAAQPAGSTTGKRWTGGSSSRWAERFTIWCGAANCPACAPPARTAPTCSFTRRTRRRR